MRRPQRRTNHPLTPRTPSEAQLLSEYEACQRTAHHLETTIWTTSTAIGLGLVGVFVLAASRPGPEQPTSFAACLIGLLSSALALMWWLLARRWWSVQQAMFLRMRHIETQLGLQATRYIQYLDDLRQGSDKALLESLVLPEQERKIRDRAEKKVWGLFYDHQKAGVQVLLLALPTGLLLCWLVYALILLATSWKWAA